MPRAGSIAACLLFGLAILAGASPIRYDFLELRLPAPPGGEASGPAPFHLVFPDSVGAIAVREYLSAPRNRAQAMLSASNLRLKPLSREERLFLSSLRALADGRLADAHREMAVVVKGRLPAKYKECLRIDAALLLYLAGLPEEAEKDWLRAVRAAADTPAGKGVAGPEEGAWRNLYSLYLTRRDFKRANDLVDEALQASPDNRWAQLAKGFLIRMLGTGDEWEGYLRGRSSWKDSLHGIQIAYGKFLADQGQWEEAVKYYNRGLEGAPSNGPAWLELADAYHRLGYLVFAEQCLQSAFRHGISDPYVYELYGKVLIDFGELADTSGAMRGLGFRLDTAWAGTQWRRAEKIVEEGFPKALESRSMAQLLYRLYCRNGRVEAAHNLRTDFWYHFTGPPPPAKAPRLSAGARFRGPSARQPGNREAMLNQRLSYVTYPLVRRLQSSDFFEIF